MTTGAMRKVEFKVMDIATATEEEAEYCYVNEDTEILYEGESLKVREDKADVSIDGAEVLGKLAIGGAMGCCVAVSGHEPVS